jgi:hypothetical protein
MKSIFKILSICSLIAFGTVFALAQTASILPTGKTTFFDSNGKPLAGGKVTFYIPGTTTLKATWQDAAETILNTNPVTLDSAGRAIIYGDGSYQQLVKDKNGNTIWNVQTSSTGSGGGSGGSATVGDGQPVGSIQLWGGFTAPSQYVFAYGQELARGSYPEFFSAVTAVKTVSCTSASPTLTGVNDTTQLSIGSHLESSCLNAGATIVSKTTSTVTVSSNAIVTTTSTARFFPYGNGDGALTFNVPDYRGLTVAGRNNMGGIASSRLTTAYFGAATPDGLGSIGGVQSTALATMNLPPYTPSGNNSTATWTQTSSTIVGVAQGFGGADYISYGSAGSSRASNAAITGTVSGTTFTGNAQGGTSTAFSLIQPTITTNYVIKISPDTNPNTFFGVASIGGMYGVITCGTGIECSGNQISGTSVANIPPAQPAVIGGVFSKAPILHQFLNSVGTDGTITSTQPTTSDISGLAAIASTGSANDLISGTTAAARGGAGTINGALKGNGSGVVSQAGASDLSNGVTGSGAVVLGSTPTIAGATITGLVNPTNPGDAANKAYVDASAASLFSLAPVVLTTAAVLPNSPTYANGASGVGATLTAGSNGALSIDGTLTTVGIRVLIISQVAQLQNGIYTVTTVGSGGAAYVLTRTTDFDQAAEMTVGKFVLTTSGATNVGKSYSSALAVTTVGTDPVTFNQIFSTGLTAINGLAGALTTGSGLITSAGPILSVNTGTSGTTIPFLDGNNIYSGTSTFGTGSGSVNLIVNGGNSGSSSGASLYLNNAGTTNAAVGGYSTIIGGAFNNDLTLFASSTTNNQLHFYYAGAERLTLNSNGIGLPVASSYLNFSSTFGASGIGIRSNAGVMEAKNSGGSWNPIADIAGWVDDTSIAVPNGGCDVGGGSKKPCQGINGNSLSINTVGTTYNNAAALGVYTDFRTIAENPGGCCFAAAAQYIKLDSGGASAAESVFPAGLFIEGNFYSGTKTESADLSLNIQRHGNGQGGTDGYEQGIAMQFFERGGQNNSRPFQGFEMDIFGDGIQPNVFGISIYAIDGQGHGFHGNTAFYAGGGTGGTAWDWGFRATGNITYAGYDTSGATITSSRSLKMARGQVIELDPRAYLYFNNSTSKLVVNIDGTDYNIKP